MSPTVRFAGNYEIIINATAAFLPVSEREELDLAGTFSCLPTKRALSPLAAVIAETLQTTEMRMSSGTV